jgi:hypothetical protein
MIPYQTPPSPQLQPSRHLSQRHPYIQDPCLRAQQRYGQQGEQSSVHNLPPSQSQHCLFSRFDPSPPSPSFSSSSFDPTTRRNCLPVNNRPDKEMLRRLCLVLRVGPGPRHHLAHKAEADENPENPKMGNLKTAESLGVRPSLSCPAGGGVLFCAGGGGSGGGVFCAARRSTRTLVAGAGAGTGTGGIFSVGCTGVSP